MKHCFKCSTDKEPNDFGLNRSTVDGLQTQCKACRRVTNNNHYQNSSTRRDTIARNRAISMKLNKTLVRRLKRAGCSNCTESDLCTLDFHHVDPALKDKEISKLMGSGFNRLKTELRKCIIVCANCHRKIHARAKI